MAHGHGAIGPRPARGGTRLRASRCAAPRGMWSCRDSSIVRYLAGESAGQCGPCVHGLPVLADGMEALAWGDGVRRALRRLRRTAEALPGSGACRHPDGVVRLVASTLKVFAVDLIRHRAGTTCPESDRGPAFPLAPAGDSS